ncbi:unannotated protein [freshwater metagenome]|uniref:Unannotated protein n=1 Tax=freshwater metagenome TaxID=449393 RepID=A0A6J7CQ13_9ZZZZ
MPAIGAPEQLPQDRAEVPNRRGCVPGRALALHRLDDLGVEAHSGVDDEPALAGTPEADTSRATGANGVEELAGCLDRISRQAQGPGEDIAAAAGNGREPRESGRDSVAQDAVDDLVDEAVATEGDDDVQALLPRTLAQGYAVALVRGERDIKVELVGQGVDEHVGDPRRGCRGPGVDQQESAHAITLAADPAGAGLGW